MALKLPALEKAKSIPEIVVALLRSLLERPSPPAGVSYKCSMIVTSQ